MNFKLKIGVFGQKLAADYLKKKDYEIQAENYFAKIGEIDLIAIKDGQIIFIEVKTRLSDKFGLPEEAVDEKKKEKLYQTGLKYLKEKQINHENFRFDCLAIEIDRLNKIAKIRHHKGI